MNKTTQETIMPNSNNVPVIPPHIMDKIKIPRKFEIFVEEFDETKEPGEWRPVRIDSKLGGSGGNPIINVNSKQEMIDTVNFYKQLNQRFKIVREIDPPSVDQIISYAKEQGIEIPNLSEQTSISCKIQDLSNSQTNDKCVVSDNNHIQPLKETYSLNEKIQNKPKIVTIGDIQIKYDGDKVYQKQWIRLTPAESSNFRIVNTASNKIVSLTGKHIEAKKWVLIENTEDDSNTTEEILND